MSPQVQLNDNLKNTAELFYSLGLEADRYKDQYDNSNFLTDSAKGKLLSQYAEKAKRQKKITINIE